MVAFIKKWRIALLAIVCFVFFKILFPNPDFFLDSGGYLIWGLDDYAIGFRPMGYTSFLMWFRDWPDNYVTLPIVQFLIFGGCTWFFNETIFKVFNIKPKFQWIFWLLTLFNPMSYFLVNLISPDNLFISLSALWLATLIRFLFWDTRKYLYLGIHLLCFIFLFYLRYNALYYPLFAVVAVALCKLKLPLKGLFAAASLALFAALYSGATAKAEAEVNTKVLSGFGGWIMANNAMHIYKVTKVDSNIFEDPELKLLSQFVTHFKDSITIDETGVTDQYMWGKSGPLKKYLAYNLQAGRYPNGYLEGWWNISTVYNDYGTTLIKHYPGAFLQSFFLPNFKMYFFPHAEMLDTFNLYHYKLEPKFQQYFSYDKEQFEARSPALEHHVTLLMKCLYAVLSPLAMLAALIAIVLFFKQLIQQRGKDMDVPLTVTFIISSFYLVTVALLTFAHPILLRYIALPLLFFSTIPILLLASLKKRFAKIFSESVGAK